MDILSERADDRLALAINKGLKEEKARKEKREKGRREKREKGRREKRWRQSLRRPGAYSRRHSVKTVRLT